MIATAREGRVTKQPGASAGPGISRRALSVEVRYPQSVDGGPRPHGPALNRDPFQNCEVHVVKPGWKVGSIGALGGRPDRRGRYDRYDCRQTGAGLAEGQHDAFTPSTIERAINGH